LNSTVTFRLPAEIIVKPYKVLPITRQVSLNNLKNQLAYTTAVPGRSQKVTVSLNFISERFVVGYSHRISVEKQQRKKYVYINRLKPSENYTYHLF
jgi:hypothetical protein